MLYHLYQFNHMLFVPLRISAQIGEMVFRSRMNPLSYTPMGKSISASCEIFERITRNYEKPEFGITTIPYRKKQVSVQENIVWEQPFCQLLHFSKSLQKNEDPGPKLLIVAPLSGHYATLLRGTVETLLPEHDIYITDWVNAAQVPLSKGSFDLDSYIDYLLTIFHILGPNTHVLAVCQPSVPVLATISLMEASGDKNTPRSMTLIGGPIDTRVNPTEVNQTVRTRDLSWFRRHAIVTVPFPHPGLMRQVYPGFMQLSGFMSMNLDRHLIAHRDLFNHLIDGDGDSAEKHAKFYDEYLSVMDLTAEFYLQTLETVFIRHALPRGLMTHRGEPVNPKNIKNVALLTIEGERDDISGPGQTKAAHDLCSNLPKELQAHHLQKGVGHYGTFNGSRFRQEIAPKIRDFIAKFH